MPHRLLALFVVVGGCATTPKLNSTAQPEVTLPITAVRYDAGATGGAGTMETSGAQARRDWSALRQAGFQELVIHPVSAAHLHELAGVAREVGLTPVLVDRDIDIFVRTGALPMGCNDLSELIARAVVRIGSSSGRRLTACRSPRTPQGKSRAREVAAALRANGVLLMPVGNEPVGWEGPAVAVIGSSLCDETSEDDSYVERWLGEYHRAIAGGLTEGILFDAGRALATSLSEPGAGKGAAERAGLAALMDRVRSWGPLLLGCAVKEVRGMTDAPTGVRVVLLTGSRRRAVFVWNASPYSISRGDVTVPVAALSGGIGRLVQWPAEPGFPAGRVVDARDGVLRIPVELRAGDADLYEAF